MVRFKWILVLVLLASVMSAGMAAGATDKDKLTYLLYGEPEGLDPANAYDARSWSCIMNLYDRLIQYEGADATKFAPMLAERWETSDDGKKITFFLRKDAKFTDGSPVKADAVKYSFDRVVKMNREPAWMMTQMMDANSTKVVDDYTVEVNLTKPYAAAFTIFANMVGSVVNPKVVEANGGVKDGEENTWMNQHAAGSGPFSLREWLPAERLVMDRNDNYWGTKPKLKQVTVALIPEVGTRVMLLRGGDADIHDHFPSVNLPDVLGAEGISVKPQPSFDIEVIALGCRGPLAEREVRQAVSYAFPYKTILSFIYQGYSKRSTGAIPEGMFGYYAIPENQRYQLNMEKANDILDKAGWKWPGNKGEGIRTKDGKRLENEILVPEGEENRIQEALMWQNNLKKIGFDLKIKQITWAIAYKVMRNHESDAFFTGWLPDYADPDNYVDALLGSENSDKIFGSSYNNPKMDELIEKAKWETDRGKRADLYKQIQELTVDDAPYVWVAQVANIVVMRNEVQGYYYNPIMPIDFRTMYKE